MSRPVSRSQGLRAQWNGLSLGKQIFAGSYSIVVAISAVIVMTHLLTPSIQPKETSSSSPPADEVSKPNHLVYYRAPSVRRGYAEERRPAWQKFAAAAPQTAGRPMIAIVIDDMGPDQKNARRAMSMAGPITLSFLPYADDLTPMVTRARANGHEVLLHLPMEPDNTHVHKAGPNSLTTELKPAEMHRRLTHNLDRFKGYVGVNNHMGSRFTANSIAMKPVIDELRRRGLLFLDSRTTNRSVGRRLSLQAGIPFGTRDIFLDNERTAKRVNAQLRRVEDIARRNGVAIAIGHPHDETLSALEQWIGDLNRRGFVLVPISAAVARSYQTAALEINSATRFD